MALSDLSFKLYTDSGLTSAFSGTLSLVHETDLSDNPQDTTYYFGSVESGRTLEATSNPGVDQITLSTTFILAEWVTLTAYILGDVIEPTTPNGFKYRVTTAGTTAASEPTWPTSGIGTTVVDGTVVWELVGAAHPITEVKLATTSGGLPGATGGDPLDIGATLTSGVGNAVEVHIRLTNTVTTPNDNVGHEELDIVIEEVQETEV